LEFNIFWIDGAGCFGSPLFAVAKTSAFEFSLSIAVPSRLCLEP
jgi:hypothetical protein